MPQSTTLGLYPIIHVPNYMDDYSRWMAELEMEVSLIYIVDVTDFVYVGWLGL